MIKSELMAIIKQKTESLEYAEKIKLTPGLSGWAAQYWSREADRLALEIQNLQQKLKEIE